MRGPPRSCAGMVVDAADPGLEPRVPAVEREMLAKDEVELLRVSLVEDQSVLEERKRRAVGRRELAEEVLAPCEHPLEDVERAGELPTELVDPRLVALRLAALCLDLVRRAFPDPVEPVQEDLELGSSRLVSRKEWRLGLPVLEVAEDHRRVEDHVAVVDQHRNERL